MEGIGRKGSAMTRRRVTMGQHGRVILGIEDGELRLASTKMALERARRIIGRYITNDEDLVDSLMADRRAEAQRE